VNGWKKPIDFGRNIVDVEETFLEIESNLCTLTFKNVKDIKSKTTAYESFIAFNTYTKRKSISRLFSKEEEKKEKKEKKELIIIK
tara:strand:+ start:1504 stop:1758 length:255 start_codon:yes stop_codon:yes gene_type:complete